MSVKGVSDVNQNIRNKINEIANRRSARIIQQVMIEGMSHVALITPINTSTLINSQYRELRSIQIGRAHV